LPSPSLQKSLSRAIDWRVSGERSRRLHAAHHGGLDTAQSGPVRSQSPARHRLAKPLPVLVIRAALRPATDSRQRYARPPDRTATPTASRAAGHKAPIRCFICSIACAFASAATRAGKPVSDRGG
jgi:hypothetical protein